MTEHKRRVWVDSSAPRKYWLLVIPKPANGTRERPYRSIRDAVRDVGIDAELHIGTNHREPYHIYTRR